MVVRLFGSLLMHRAHEELYNLAKEAEKAGRGRETTSKRQFAEILVEGHHDTVFALGDREYLLISDARIIGAMLMP